MENLRLEGERFIRSFLYNLYKKEIIELDVKKQPELKNPLHYIAAYDTEEWAHHIIWVDVNELTTAEMLEYFADSPLLKSIIDSYKHYCSDYLGTVINFLSDKITIINKRKLGEKEFWDDILKFEEYNSPKKETENRIITAKENNYEELLELNNLQIKNKALAEIQNMPSVISYLYEQKKKGLLEQVDTLINQIKSIKEDLRCIELEYINRFIQDEENSIFTKLINFINKCKFVSHYKIVGPSKRLSNSKYSAFILLKPFPISYTYGEEAANKLIYESTVFTNHTNKDILMDAITLRSRYEIYHKPVTISITYSQSNDTGLIYSIEKHIASKIKLINEHKDFQEMYSDNERFENRHYFRFNCLGSFKPDLTLAQTSLDPTRLFATLLQYLQTINLADYAGTQWLHQDHMIYDKQENRLILLKASTGEIIPIHSSLEDLTLIAPLGFYKKGN